MCPMRIFVFLFSLILLMYFSAKWAVSDGTSVQEDSVQSKQGKVQDAQKAFRLQRVFVLFCLECLGFLHGL
jgi:hypothetical protein